MAEELSFPEATCLHRVSLAGDDLVYASVLPAKVMRLLTDGGAGDDLLVGSAGADVLDGGAGSTVVMQG